MEGGGEEDPNLSGCGARPKQTMQERQDEEEEDGEGRDEARRESHLS